ncbi:MAG: NTP transferase domain-containing protein [Kofleriaceae bacterium]
MSGAVVVLGAGLGSRLRPLTDDRPKCVVAVGGEPLAARMLRQFHARGIHDATVVVGHMADRARELLSDAASKLSGLRVRFVENKDYATTNTMYSTLLAMDALAGGGYLVEGDIAASDEVIDRLIAADAKLSHWAADAWTSAHSGCRLTANATGRITAQEIFRARTAGPMPGMWKSAGMLKLSGDGAAALSRALSADAAAGRTNVYYDDVIGARMGDFDLRVLDLADAPWVEIDDLTDMAEARRLFEQPNGGSASEAKVNEPGAAT